MDSPIEYDLLDFPNNFQITMKKSTGIIKNSIQLNSNETHNKKSKASFPDDDKNTCTGMIMKIFKKFKTSQEKVMMELHPHGASHCHNQTIFNRIKPSISNIANDQKIHETCYINGNLNLYSNQNDEYEKNLIAGSKRK